MTFALPLWFLWMVVLPPPLSLGWNPHACVDGEAASPGGPSLSVSLAWPGLPWISCYGPY